MLLSLRRKWDNDKLSYFYINHKQINPKYYNDYGDLTPAYYDHDHQSDVFGDFTDDAQATLINDNWILLANRLSIDEIKWLMNQDSWTLIETESYINGFTKDPSIEFKFKLKFGYLSFRDLKNRPKDTRIIEIDYDQISNVEQIIKEQNISSAILNLGHVLTRHVIFENIDEYMLFKLSFEHKFKEIG